MLNWLRRWLVPSFADEDLNRRTFLLNVMALAALLFSLVVNLALIMSLLPDGWSDGMLIAIITLLVSFLWVGIIFFFSRRGRVGVGSHVLLWGAVALVTAANLTDPNTNMEDPAWSLLAVVVVAAALLLGTRATLLFMAVGITLYLGANLAEIWGWIPRAVIRPEPNVAYRIALNGGVLGTLAVLGLLFGSGLERALKRARRQTAELAEAKGHLERTQAYLEQTVERTVAEYTAFAQRVAAGDLTSRLDLVGEEDSPLLALGRSLNAMVEGLQRISMQVHATVADLTALSSAIQTVCAEQAAGAEEESGAIAAASSTISEVQAITQQTAERAQRVAALAQQTAAVARSGHGAVADTVAGMEQVKERVAGTAEHMQTLSEQMETIEQIITTVGEFTTRSKLLALNAAVEAARAGDAGRSFAVVAGEMRGLADQSRVATERVSQIIAEIQKKVQAAAEATAEGVRRADNGVLLAGKAGEAIAQLSADVQESTAAAVQIAAAAGPQMAGTEQIAQAMDNIRQVTARGLTSTQQAERSAGELNLLADRLREIVAQYRL